jgi:hypothetical protein
MKFSNFILILLVLLISGCSSSEENDDGGNETLDKSLYDVEIVENSKFEEISNNLKFNSDLNEFETKWLNYLDDKYQNSKIYHIKTKLINCEDCYEVTYKKDREIIRIKVLDGEKTNENLIYDDIAVDIENEDVCSLFSGTWNTCPKLCNTDEEACQTQCGLPTCEFDEDLLVFRELGEVCGELEFSDCAYGLTCSYLNKSDDTGICVGK